MNAEFDLIDLFVAPLETHGFSNYMITGSIASIEYGEPRATLDLDMAITLSSHEIPRLTQFYPDSDYYLPPPEVIATENRRATGGHFNVIHFNSGLKADCYPSQSHPMQRWALQHRQRHAIRSIDAWFAPPEYVILWKLEFHREGNGEKHLRDIRGMLEVSGDRINHQIIETFVEIRNLAASWNLVLQS